MRPERRSSFVLNTTISELILLLFFLLLLLLMYAYLRNADLTKEKEDLQQQVTSTEQAMQQLKLDVAKLKTFYEKVVAQLPEAEKTRVADTLVAVSKLHAAVAELNKNKENLAKEILSHQALLEQLKKMAKPHEVPDTLRKEIGDLAFCRQAKESMSRLQGEKNDLASDLTEQRRIAGEAVAKAKACGKGEDYVACWRDPVTNKIEYMFEVLIDGKTVKVKRRWPDGRRDAEMQRFPAARDLVNREVLVDEFLSATLEVFEHSQVNHCRHYVDIAGSKANMGTAMFNQFMRIQDHFYKFSSIR